MRPPTAISARRFSRSWWFQQTRNMLWVAVVTVLIWIYADMEFTEVRDFTVTLHFQAPPNSKMVLESPNDIEVIFRARGNRNSLDKFENSRKVHGGRIEIDLTSYKPGDNVVPAEELLEKDVDFSKSGLSVVSGAPSLVQFRLDQLIAVPDVRVELDYVGATLARPPVLTPNTMTIHVPQSQWLRLRQDLPEPVLKTEQVNLQKIATDQPIVVEILPTIGNVNVLLLQPTVRAEVQVKTITETMAMNVNVRVVEPVSWLGAKNNTWKEFELVRKDTLEWRKQIVVTGSKKDLEALKAREQEIVAFVTLTEEDKKPVSWNMRNVTICFPPDIPVKLAPGETPTVQFKLVPITR